MPRIRRSETYSHDLASGGAGGGLDVEAGAVTLENTIVALDTNGSDALVDDIAGAASPASAYNLIGTGGSGGLTAGANCNPVGVADPGLDANGLQNKGRPTQTIALLPGSPVIGAFQYPGFTLTLTPGSSPHATRAGNPRSVRSHAENTHASQAWVTSWASSGACPPRAG